MSVTTTTSIAIVAALPGANKSARLSRSAWNEAFYALAREAGMYAEVRKAHDEVVLPGRKAGLSPEQVLAKFGKAAPAKTPKAKKFRNVFVCECGVRVQTNRMNQKRCTECSQKASAQYLAARTVWRIDAQMVALGVPESMRDAVRPTAVDLKLKGNSPENAVRMAYFAVTATAL